MVVGFGKFAKYALFFVNFTIFVLGAVVIGFVVTIYVSEKHVEKHIHYVSGVYVWIIAVSIVIVLSVLGICGAFTEKKIVLLIFIVCFSTILLMIIVGMGFGIGYKDEINKALRKEWKNYIKKYEDNTFEKTMMDHIQYWYQCCGVTDDNITISWHSWSKLNEYEFGRKVKIPDTCCKDVKNLKECVENPTESNAYLYDCIVKYRQYIEKYSKIILGTVIGITFTMAMGIGLSCYLYSQIETDLTYKEFLIPDLSTEVRTFRKTFRKTGRITEREAEIETERETERRRTERETERRKTERETERRRTERETERRRTEIETERERERRRTERRSKRIL